MSEGDVTLIQDEDVLRRMWQQTEDFSQKKVIRAHMYKLREQRLRSLYTPEPAEPEPAIHAKGCEFSSRQLHGSSFEDQSFQRLKSKEVRDAGSPPKEFIYRAQELKDMSNAGWNVESENKTTDDGHTRVRSVHANIEGKYDVEGGQGKFAAVDHQRQAVTEYHDDNTSVMRNESAANTASHEHVERKTEDGSQYSSTSSSQTSSSKFEQMSTTKREIVPIATNESFDHTDDTNLNTQKITKLTDFEQNLRSDKSGELISRKVDYPDENTRTIVETRLLADGTRITSTRQEFRAPAVHVSRSEQHSQHSRSENKFSSQQTANIRESSSHTSQESIDKRHHNLQETQTIRDNIGNDAQKKKLTKKDSQTVTSDTLNSKVTEHFTTEKERINKESYETKVDETRHKVESRNNQNTQDLTESHCIKNEIGKKIEETLVRKTSSEQYQTTYQNDFSQKKISTDLSPTHQAWASTLRAETPSTHRSSTRASSPGSRTYMSSTSSLRSSISPEKTTRKPSSRGGSPNKIDRNSPSRSIDRYSNATDSTYSISETKTTKYASPERSGPHSRPPKPYSSPDTKPQDGCRNRASASPEKRSKSYATPSSSPERKPSHKGSSSNSNPRTVSPRRSDSPRDYTRPTPSPERKYPTLPKKETSQTETSDIPDEDIGHIPHTSSDKPSLKETSPEEKPGYMRPTEASKMNESSPRTSPPRPNTSPERKLPSRATPSPDHSFKNNYSKTTSIIKEDHYKFIDEETKMHTHFDRETNSTSRNYSPSPERLSKTRKNTSPVHSTLPRPDAPDCGRSASPALTPTLKSSRSPSPPKGPVTFIEETSSKYDHQIKSNTSVITDTTKVYDRRTDDYKKEVISKQNDDVKRHTPQKEPSPPRYGTYDRKQRLSQETEITTTSEDTKHDSLTRRQKTGSLTKMEPEPSKPAKKAPEKSISPDNSLKKEKYKHTTDFISMEKKTEQVSKNACNKDHPRQLITPSSSPTRKPKTVEKAPSTGQSSPTTSVSEIIYFSSLRPNNSNGQLVTDLDDHDNYSEVTMTEDVISFDHTKRPNSLSFKRSPSPTKIPCRSPTQDSKKISPTKENLPRKSSLKKPSVDMSPIEKPPTNFRISPTTETKDFVEHKIVKKDSPEKPEEPKMKTKPPLERRETYEERCRKILGMMEDDKLSKSEKTSKSTFLMKPDQSSPSVSPCRSPRESPLRDIALRSSPEKAINTTTVVTDFLTHEKEELTNSSDIKEDVTTLKKKNHSRDSSPTKLKDIMSIKPMTNSEDVKVDTVNSNTMNNKNASPVPSKTCKAPESLLLASTRDVSPSKQSRSSSPIKKTTVTSLVIENDFITTEREQEILDRVQQSLRKLSPNRIHRTPSPEKRPNQSVSVQKDINTINTTATTNTSSDIKSVVDKTTTKENTIQKIKTKETPRDLKTPSKLPARNTSPSKKTPINVSKPEKKTESPTKPRSESPRKPVSPTERSASPQIPKPSNIHSRESIASSPTRRPVSSPSKLEKSMTSSTELKKTSQTTKQNSFTNSTSKSTVTSKIAQSTTNKTVQKDVEPKGNKENVSPKKEPESKLPRTSIDNSIKPMKKSPQRIKSKPEIQINDVSSKTIKLNSTGKSSLKLQQDKFPTKPKSATALNIQSDENDMIVDVQQAKSSRENSPDHICPTPISFLDDVGTPRLPDEVSEPDDEFIKRTHHIIHESESSVDDIMEISEEEELSKTNVDHITASDECLLTVTDKVSKFTKKIDSVTKPKESTTHFKDFERSVHSDFIDDKLKSDECLLSVSEKVNKFASGPKGSREKSPNYSYLRNEYDTNTVYQDEHTKLSVNDKAHFFVESAEKVAVPKVSPKVERPDLTKVDESLQSDDCLLSVSDKVNKFVKTAEQFLNETHEVEDKEKKIKEQHDKIMQIVTNIDNYNDTINIEENIENKEVKHKQEKPEEKLGSFARETASSHAKQREYSSSNLKQAEKSPIGKITTLRSSDAVKKAKALFENIATTAVGEKTSISTHKSSPATKLTDIGVIKKSPKTDSTIALHPSEECSPYTTDVECEVDARQTPTRLERPSSGTPTQTHPSYLRDDKPRNTPNRLTPQLQDSPRGKSPTRQSFESTTKSISTRYTTQRPEALQGRRDKSPEKSVYQRVAKTSLTDEEKVNDIEVSTRRGSGKFGVELRRTSLERSTISSERRRSSDHHQPCIEDVFDLSLLEQMLEKVVGYEQRRRIRAQIRVAKKKLESERVDTNTYSKTTKHYNTVKTRSPERKPPSQRTVPSEPVQVKEPLPMQNGHAKEPTRGFNDKRQRPESPEKPRTAPKTKSPTRHPSPEKKTRTQSPTKAPTTQTKAPTTPKAKSSRFNDYASAYMKKVGLTEADKLKQTETQSKTEKITENEQKIVETHHMKTTSSSKTYTQRTSSKDTIEVVEMNGKRSTSPEKRPDRKSPTERLYQRSPSPDFKRPVADAAMPKETIIKTVIEVDKKVGKPAQEEKPSWVMNRNLKKTSSEMRTFSSKKVESDRKYRAASPSKALSRPLDVITSGYGPGPLDADGRPLFGIKALRNGATNYQVKGTVVQQAFRSRNGSSPEGVVQVTAYSTQPEQLERLLAAQGERPSRLHGLAAITTTKRFGGDSGTTLREAHTKEDRAALEQFTHSDRRVETKRTEDRKMESSTEIRGESRRVERGVEGVRAGEWARAGGRPDRKTVRQSSVKSLTEKYIKNASDTTKSARATYPKAGLILRSGSGAGLRDSLSSDSEHAAAGINRTDSEHSLNSTEGDCVVESKSTATREKSDAGFRETRTTTTRSSRTSSQPESRRLQERSFLDSSTKVTGVQDILTRMKNADIVIEDGDSNEDAEARALLNKFLGATVLMAGMQSYVADQPSVNVRQESVRSKVVGADSGAARSVQDIDVDQCWDERVLRKLLEECTDYEQRRRVRTRLRSLMAEQEACASAVTEALAAAAAPARADCDAAAAGLGDGDAREEEEVTTVTSSVRRNSSEKTVSSSTTTKTSKVIESMTKPAPKAVSPFAKFRQLEKQNSVNSPKM